MESDYLIPCVLGLVRESLRDWCGPAVCGLTGRAVPWHFGGDRAVEDLVGLDLARPEVRDHLARVLGPWGLWHTPAEDGRDGFSLEECHRLTLYYLRLVDIARAVGLDPKPREGEDWGLRFNGCWMLERNGLVVARFWPHDRVPEDAPGNVNIHLPALADITDPHEAAGIIWEVTYG